MVEVSTNEGGAKIIAVEDMPAGIVVVDSTEAPTGSRGAACFDFWP